jgi:hypothetical protein
MLRQVKAMGQMVCFPHYAPPPMLVYDYGPSSAFSAEKHTGPEWAIPDRAGASLPVG